jgi:serine protease Do
MSVHALTEELAQRLGAERTQGVVVTNVEVGSVAADVGIRPGDIITSVAGKSVRNLADYRQAMQQSDLSKGIRIQVWRDGAQRFVLLRAR